MRSTLPGRSAALLAACCLALATLLPGGAGGARARTGAALPEIAVADLPTEARDVLALIRNGGPFRYDRDGVTFGNREQLLPAKPRGYYHEYTVPHAGRRRAAARAASSAAARRPRRTRATTPTTTTSRSGGSANEAARSSAISRMPAWSSTTARREVVEQAAAAAGLRYLAGRPRAGRAPSARCSPRSPRARGCPSTSATTGTRSPTASRTATGWARTARDRASRTRPPTARRTRTTGRRRGDPRRGGRLLARAAHAVLGLRRLNAIRAGNPGGPPRSFKAWPATRCATAP